MREPSQADGEAKPKLPDVNEEESELQVIPLPVAILKFYYGQAVASAGLS